MTAFKTRVKVRKETRLVQKHSNIPALRINSIMLHPLDYKSYFALDIIKLS